MRDDLISQIHKRYGKYRQDVTKRLNEMKKTNLNDVYPKINLSINTDDKRK